MIMKSYIDKMFIVIDADARVRDPNDLSKTLRDGAGNPIVIPKLCEIRVTNVQVDNARNVFVFVERTADGHVFGWTKASNLKGQFTNETLGSSPKTWVLFPSGKNMTVVDNLALVRSGPPNFTSTGQAIPRGTFVLVSESSTIQRGTFLRINRARLEGDQAVAQDEIGWTSLLNLADGWSNEYSGGDFANHEGPNAAWRSGEFIGQKILVDIVGTGGQLENVTLSGLEAYMKLRNAVAERENIELSIESGFRSFPRQKRLRELFEAGQGNLAAKAGFSNHQHGQAFDLNTSDKLFDRDPIYRALKAHGPGLGFIRTVSGEPWHWEFRPQDAAQQGFKMPGVDP